MKATGILLKVRGDGRAFARAAAQSMGAAESDIERILTVPADQQPGLGAAATDATWLRIDRSLSSTEAWDRIHSTISNRGQLGSAGGDDIITAEPDFEQTWLFDPAYASDDVKPPGLASSGTPAAPPCFCEPQTDEGGRAVGPAPGWSLGDDFSQLTSAAKSVSPASQKRIVICHLDTGFDPDHICKPANLDASRQFNFIEGENQNDARDVTPSGGLRNPGHGPGTIGILAGGRVTQPEWAGFDVPIGGVPHATVVPVRIANSVVHFTTSSMAKGFSYATSIGSHILTMSMGGLSSDLLVDAINQAYDSGMFMVTAAGNHFSRTPMPRTIVFPARYRRIIAATGVMADGRAYFGLERFTMQGNHGPDSKMDTALGAYTPNIPWPELGCTDNVDMDGGGTSSATPQVAAAAALWYARHWNTIKDYPGWARVEAARFALFRSAAKTTAKMNAKQTHEMAGMGVLRARDALEMQPAAVESLHRLPPSEPSWSWLDMLTGGGVSLGVRGPAEQRQIPMLKLELTQMAQRFSRIERAIVDPDGPVDKITPAERARYLERVLEEGDPSKPLRLFLENLIGARPPRKKAKPRRPIRRRQRPANPPPRRLRIYSFDPSIAQSTDFFTVNETTLSLPWDDEPQPRGDGADTSPSDQGGTLKPGPVGEYLEVIDIDPASGKIYEPVDLNDKYLLAQDGLAPSEGNPKFHQQMVYAVGMLTIGTFERALGRRALWAPLWDESTRRRVPVERLRIYPHALRAENAYYSPDKRALLFGYFQSYGGPELVAPGSMVFTCLSSDIIAHEMSHALLDGLHRHFTVPSNPDVLAFHEAFADIVAIFQHFTFKDIVRFEISRARGEMTAATLLGGLAMQFGHGSGRSGPLRNYSDPTKATHDYLNTEEAHDRGSILVFAIYDAFLKIVSRRTADLIRLATGGTGILTGGALQPDLVERMTDETCKSASHFLNICIRALDYCPAVDITFGEYLRGLVTADVDAVPDDRVGYRVALIEAFRTRGILPRTVKTISEETLTWNTYFDRENSEWIEPAVESLDLGWDLDRDRSEALSINEDNRRKFERELDKAFQKDPDLLEQFGLERDIPYYDDDGKARSSRGRRGPTTFEVYDVRPARRIAPDGSFRTELIAVIHQRQPIWYDDDNHDLGWFWFFGGATVIIDPRPGNAQVRYAIIKNSGSETRQERQRQYGSGMAMSPLRSLYFGEDVAAEPFSLVHNKVGGY